MRDGYVARARLDQARGDWDSARAFITRAEQVARRSRSSRDIPLLAAWRARLSLAEGDRKPALAWAKASGLSPDDPPGFLQEYAHLTLARVLLAQGRLPAAARLLRRLLAAAESAGRRGRVIEILAVYALVLQAQDHQGEARAALERGLRLAEPEGYVRVFADEGAPMAALLAGVRGEQRGYAEGLRAAIVGQSPDERRMTKGDGRRFRPGESEPGLAPDPDSPFAVRHSSGQEDRPTLLAPLSDRERAVLRLLAAGLSNQDIAAELVVATSTVHWHLKNIYSKLNVHSRTRAAAAARELGLLTPP